MDVPQDDGENEDDAPQRLEPKAAVAAAVAQGIPAVVALMKRVNEGGSARRGGGGEGEGEGGDGGEGEGEGEGGGEGEGEVRARESV